MVDRQGEEAAVGVGADAGRAPAFRQQADLCEGAGGVGNRENTVSKEKDEKWPLSPT